MFLSFFLKKIWKIELFSLSLSMIELNGIDFVNLPSVKLGIRYDGTIINSSGNDIGLLESMPSEFWTTLSLSDFKMILHVVEFDRLNDIVNQII